MWGKRLLQKGLKWSVGNGRQLSAFHDEWIANAINPYGGRAMENSFGDFKVADMFNARTRSWRSPLVSVLFPDEFFEKHAVVLREDQPKFDLWGKVWLPPKLQLFIWKLRSSQAQAEDVECGQVRPSESVCRFGGAGTMTASFLK
ncbi:hypothetical protein RHMOL_Rhmol03G0271100 [Rhododendron molle]|uniref:Uncharacterized protein n=1 Tax=Rhododendron molle TaxID=49168 RepID=A0ACC0PIS6_RHOML|nr:hypothetical protein RHMOL_Rhmol03G0271100 [Rhododendron molle]